MTIDTHSDSTHGPATLASITFDCADPLALAGFWAVVLDRQAPTEPGDFAQLAGSPSLSFMRVPEGKAAKNRVHLDIDVSDRAATTARLIGLGASRLADHDEHGFTWTTMADPEGNEFCVVGP